MHCPYQRYGDEERTYDHAWEMAREKVWKELLHENTSLCYCMVKGKATRESNLPVKQTLWDNKDVYGALTDATVIVLT
jgi:hypothetical protein